MWLPNVCTHPKTEPDPLEPTESIAALVADARRGHDHAWDRLFRRFAPVVHGILLGSVPFTDAEDLTQHVFETALRHLPGLRDDHTFPGWLAKIARNAAMDFHRRPGPVTSIEFEDVPVAARQEDQVDAQRVLQIIRGLPEAYRETLLLRLVEGLSGPEIAVATGLTEGSVRVNLHRGMSLLREAMALPRNEEER